LKILFLVIISSFFISTELTGYDIIKSIEDKDKPDNIKANLTMKSIKKGKTRTSKFISWSKNAGELQLMWFIEPRQYKGMSFLNIDNNMTMWLPSYKKIRKVSSKNKNKSFMNSDLSYADFDIRDIDMYTYKKNDEYELYDNQECYIIISFPKNTESSNYSKHKTWISKNDLKPLKEISFDQEGRPIKEKIFSYTKKDSLDIIQSLIVKNLQKNSYTTLNVENIKLNTDLNIDYFKEINLKRIPK
tara:strand:+ start:1714 stop:2448 length:735 start_codon:yes stop_codon:yes gene_type:complete